jgi:Arc/MetJ family transcription regulator
VRTNIEIDDDLMRAAMAAGGFPTERETVSAALELFVRMQKLKAGYDAAQRQLLALEGQIDWEGDLDALRRDR